MKTFTYILFSLVLGLHVAQATNQVAERVDYDGKEWTLYAYYSPHFAQIYFPFESYLKSNDSTFHSYLKSAIRLQETNEEHARSLNSFLTYFSTACMRGYIAKWKIEGERLFLVEIHNPNSFATNTCPLNIFSPSWKSPVFAYWVTQKVLLAGKEYRNDIVLDEYARIRELQIEEGIIKAVTDKNALFGISTPAALLNEKMRLLKSRTPSPAAFKHPLSESEINTFFERIQELQRGMLPEEVKAILGQAEETSTWEPPLTSKNEFPTQGDIEREKHIHLNIFQYTMRYYLYKEKQGRLDVGRDVYVTFDFRFDNYPDKSKRSLKKVW